MQSVLLTWRLTPAGKESELWSSSTYQGEIWVRAHDAIEARNLAANRFSVDASAKSFHGQNVSPWCARELVHCEIVQNSRFDSVDIACVVHPAHHHAPVDDLPSAGEQASTASKTGHLPEEDLPSSEAR